MVVHEQSWSDHELLQSFIVIYHSTNVRKNTTTIITTCYLFWYTPSQEVYVNILIIIGLTCCILKTIVIIPLYFALQKLNYF